MYGVPYQFVSNTGEMNYRLNVIYNNSNLISKTVLVPSVPTATTKNNYVQVAQEIYSIALWIPV
ncbi:MAG: hypothetical protein ACKPKO_65990, partial [Candidatus Fonsibacter sp.]